VPDHFSRPEVLEILQEYYSTLEDKVEVQLHRYARGER
jgi:sulfate adenylyltransferase